MTQSNRPRICVIEDNPDNRLLLRALLSDRYAITEYDHGIAALQGLHAAPVDLVLLDIALPRMDGVAVLSRIRADSELRATPVIALTAHAMAGDREKYLAAGFDAYVSKPIVDEGALIDAIERLLAHRHLR
jgi:CheY-like chemotaxis protein